MKTKWTQGRMVQIGGGLNLEKFNLTDLTSCIFIGYFLLFVIDTFMELSQYKFMN